MARFNNPLAHVKIATPCSADWEQMVGNDRSRFCGQCNLNVYNLSGMSRSEAESLIGNAEGRLCVRYYLRKDGSILTQDCPVGLAAVRRRMSTLARSVSSAVLSFFAGLGVYHAMYPVVRSPVMGDVMGTIAVSPPVPLFVVQGEMPRPEIPRMGKMKVALTVNNKNKMQKRQH